MSTKPIILYDIPSNAPGCAWSPNTWIVRYALNYKNLPFKTTWVEYPDIADTCKAIGAAPSMMRRDGSPYYSLPVIADPNTGSVITDSLLIAEYLDETYPATLVVVPKGTHALQKGFRAGYDALTDGSTSFIMPAVARILRPRSQEYFVRTREASFEQKLSEMTPSGEAREAAWEKFKMGFERVSKWLKEGDAFFMGDKPSYADFVVAGEMQWFLSAFGKDSDEWKDILTWQGGRWAQMVDKLKKYEGPVEEGP